jgi:hypothetical protein
LITKSCRDLLLNPRNTDHLFVGGYADLSGTQLLAMHKSLDGGTTWETYTILDSAAADSVQTIGYAVAVDPGNDRTIYLGGGISGTGALYKSLDGGTTWTKLAAGTFADPILDLAVDPALPTTIYAGTAGGLFRSETAGASWIRLAEFAAGCIYIDPARTSSLTVAGADGVYASADRGSNWTDLNATLPVRNVLTLGVAPTSGTLYVGTNGGGVFRYRQTASYLLSLSATTGGTTDPVPGNHAYDRNSSVVVTALPDGHFAFTGWTGSLSGTANPLTVRMDSDKSLTASFERIIYPPLAAAGVKEVNRGVISAEYINFLTWQDNPDNADVRAYRVYLEEGTGPTLLAELDASILEFKQRGVGKDTTYVYEILAVDKTGREGQAAIVTVR